MPTPICAKDFIKRWQTFSGPVAVRCTDGRTYVLKGLRSDRDQSRAIYNDQVAARLGHLCGAPVPEVALVELPQELIDVNSGLDALGHMLPGVCHGVVYLDNVTEREDGFLHVDQGDNKLRFSRTALFQAWLGCQDRQFIYRTAPPYEVFSCDHGHYFPSGPDWTVQSLNTAPTPVVAADLMQSCNLSTDDLKQVISQLGCITDGQIDHALAFPPAAWGVTVAERDALGKFLRDRRNALVATYV